MQARNRLHINFFQPDQICPETKKDDSCLASNPTGNNCKSGHQKLFHSKKIINFLREQIYQKILLNQAPERELTLSGEYKKSTNDLTSREPSFWFLRSHQHSTCRSRYRKPCCWRSIRSQQYQLQPDLRTWQLLDQLRYR